ncbi:dihydrolipoamide succinyltransferase, partial [Escherichia coli]
MKKEIIVPKAGLTMTEATVGLWLVSEGDPVEKDQVVLELATDKITVEVTAPYDGIMVSILHQEGETVATGECLAIMETEAAEAERS